MQGEETKFVLKVNGEEFEMRYRVVVAHDILELAEKVGAIPGQPRNFRLESVSSGHAYGFDDEVDLEKDNIFVAMPVSPTPVA